MKKFKFKLKLACFRIPTSTSWLKAAVQGRELSLPEDNEEELSDVDGTPAAELTELLKLLGQGEINVDDLEFTDTDV